MAVNRPPWIARGVVLTGRTLMRHGVELVPVFPEHSYLLGVGVVR